MNRHSLIVYITLFFLFLMGIINTLFYIQYRDAREQIVEHAFKLFHESQQLMHMGRQEQLPLMAMQKRLHDVLGVEIVQEQDAGGFRDGTLLDKRHDITAYAFEGMIYLYIDDRRRGLSHLLRFPEQRLGIPPTIWFALLIDLAVILFFLYVIRKIWPLKQLKHAIARFSQGDLNVQTKLDGKDEIAEVANEFDHAIHRIRQLQESRNLFLRNIMHELKTPIAKGKLVADLLDDTKNSTRLNQIFSRFEFLLREFAKIERVTSNEFNLSIKPFRTVDILDNALDLLMIEHDAVLLELKEESEIHADFELFSIAVKNLIDNALKYGTGKPKIIIDETMIAVCSKGEALDDTMFDKVFNRTFEDSSKGLGLGLYITQSIVKKHGFDFNYYHTSGTNFFEIRF